MRIFIILFFIFGLISPIAAQEARDYLDMPLEDLLNMTITTAGKSEEKVSDIPASVIIITRRDIELQGYTTLTDALEHIPGLYNINDYYDVSGNFGFRGFWSGNYNTNIVIMVNGVNQSVTGTTTLGRITVPVDAIDRIEVIRGPMSVIYGSGAAFGVINIVTNQVGDQQRNFISAGFGERNIYKSTVHASGREGDLTFAATAALYSDEGIDVPFADMVANPQMLPYFGVPEDYTTHKLLENDNRYFHFSGSLRDFYFDASYNESINEYFFLFPAIDNGDQIQSTRTNFLMGYKNKLSDKVSFDGKLLYHNQQRRNTYEGLFPGFYGVEDYLNTGLEAEANLLFKARPNLDVLTGFVYRQPIDTKLVMDIPSAGDPSIINRDSNIENQAIRSFFSQATYQPGDKLKFVAGLRLENWGKYKNEVRYFNPQTGGSTYSTYEFDDAGNIHFFPRIAAVYHANNRHIFKLLYGEGGKQVNPAEDPELTRTIELNHIASSKRWMISSSLFRNSLANLENVLWEYNPDTQQFTFRYDYSGQMQTLGAEVTGTFEPLARLTLEVSGTYQETTDDKNEDIDVAYSPKMLGYLKAAYAGKSWSLGLSSRYVDQMEAAWNPGRVNPDDSFGGRIGDAIDGYFVLDANFRLEDLVLKGLSVSVHCRNLLDKEVRYPVTRANSGTVFSLQRGTLGEGRTIFGSVSWRF